MEKLNYKKLSKLLHGTDFAFFNTVDSTFNVTGHDVVIAANQTSATGRLSRPFFCGLGGIYLCVRTPLKPLLTVSAAAGVLRALKKHGVNAQVKWVNDILLNGKKVAGILAKSNADYAVVGVGINYCVNLPMPLQALAGSIKPSTKGINAFTADLLGCLFEAFSLSGNLEFYKAHLFGLGKEIVLPDSSSAKFVDVTNEGNLVYIKDGKQGTLLYGDIHL